MSRTRLALIAAAGILLASQISWAASAAVGTCKPSLFSFTTIQDAVDHSASGTTIFVCPGTYPEQVKIAKPLILTGVSFGSQDAPVIVPPTGTGLTANATSLTSGNPIAAQIWVHDTTGVNISNLTVDGVNNMITGCSPNVIGILYQDASGTISRVVARNQILSPYSSL
ncbi:MAG TPA: hypothetical protein VGR48_03040, partial [Terriglobales bacterium]|nr:hypothetical protein [Terriglobales bacterium]